MTIGYAFVHSKRVGVIKMVDEEQKQTIDHNFFRNYPEDRGGLILDFSGFAVEDDKSKDFIGYFDYPLRDTFYSGADKKDLHEKRNNFARPKLLADFEDRSIEGLPDITCSGITIKRAGEMHIALPDIFDFALQNVLITAQNVIDECGIDRFEQSTIALVIQRNDVEVGSSHRSHVYAGSWHDHVSGHETSDMVFLSSNRLGTVVKDGSGGDIITPDNSLCRIGGEWIHKSQENKTDKPIHREWMGITVSLEPIRFSRNQQNMCENPALITVDNPLFDEYVENAQKVLSKSNKAHIYDEPVDLINTYSPEFS